MWTGIIGTSLWICLLGISHGLPKGGNRIQQSIAESTALFMRDVYDILKNQTEKNIVISPFSIHLALAMTSAGARGKTASQLSEALHLNLDPYVFSAYRSILLQSKAEKLKGHEPDYTLEIANKIYVDDNFVIYNNYTSILKQYFLAQAESTDFSKTEVAREMINQWVAEVTRNMIPSLIPQGVLTEDTQLVLANALYFKGTWLEKFDKENTFPEKFYVNGESIDVDMMHMWSVMRAGVIDELDAKVLELPYKGKKYAMMLLLPNQKDSLPDLEKKLASYDLDESFRYLQPRDVNIALPKFELEFSQQLKAILQKLGITDLFNDLSDLSGISNSRLLVSDVVHKAKIEVNEEGARAAASTGVIIVNKIANFKKPQPLLFHANHPFLFYIRDVEKGLYMFNGRVHNPGPTAKQFTVHSHKSDPMPSQESELPTLSQESELPTLSQKTQQPIHSELTTGNEITINKATFKDPSKIKIIEVGGHPVQEPLPEYSNGLYFPAPDPDHIVDYNCKHKEWENLPIHLRDSHVPQPKSPCPHKDRDAAKRPREQ